MADVTPKEKRTIPKTVWLTAKQARDLERKCSGKRVGMPPATFMYQAILSAIYGQDPSQ